MPNAKQLHAIAQWGSNNLGDGTKRCRKCGVAKPLSAFHLEPSCKTDGRKATCRACLQPSINAWYRAWQKRPKGREVMRANCAKRYQENKHLYIESNAVKRALTKRATPSWSIKFFVEEAYRLAALRTKMTGIKWHVDHIVPLRSKVVCGLHAHTNIRVIPQTENASKGNRHWPDMPR